MKVLLDTNILLNWLINQNTKHIEATKLVKLCLNKQLEVYLSSHSLTDIFYILRKYQPNVEIRRNFILFAVNHFSILTEDADCFLEVLNDANFFDLEDGLQMKLAEKVRADYIITENLKDFKNSKIPALDIEAALQIICYA